MLSMRNICCVAALAVSLPAFAVPGFAYDVARLAPLPQDAPQISAGQAEPAVTPERRAAAVDLVRRARTNSSLTARGQSYDIKVTFTVNSGGATQYDGVWQMEDMFVPHQGLRWTASAGAYNITEIRLPDGKVYAQGTPGHIPLRLQEARAALFGALPAPARLRHETLRTTMATVGGTPVTCLLISPERARSAAQTASPRRLWRETEECIDPQTGLLHLASQAPGRYYTYDYSNPVQLAGRVLPSKITVSEAGQKVSEIVVDSATELTAGGDPSLFVPTPQMKEDGHPPMMVGAEKVVRVYPSSATVSGGTAHAVCIFGVITPSGKLAEAHSLQPSDPYSAAALEAAQKTDYTQPTKPGAVKATPQQRFLFFIAKFVPRQ